MRTRRRGCGVTDILRLRAAITGLIGLAAAEEQTLLATAAADEAGTAHQWAAIPLVAHNTDFRQQQVQRLEAVYGGTTPAEFTQVDHESAELYAALATRPASQVARESWASAGDLVAAAGTLSAADLLDPTRHLWLRGRQLWLEVIVRGFGHPVGHLAEYYANHLQPDRAVKLAEHAVTTAQYLAAPDPARGMAIYNLACAQAGAGLFDTAAAAVGEAITLNPDIRANAARDRDLAVLRDSGRLAAVLGA